MERAGAGSRTLFPTGPSFTLEDFSGRDFIVRDFVDSLAENAVAQNRRSGTASQAFDPKPLIRGFESMTPDSTKNLLLWEDVLMTPYLRRPARTRQSLRGAAREGVRTSNSSQTCRNTA